MHDHLHWLVIPQRVQYKFAVAVTVHRCLRQRPPRYLVDYCVPVSERCSSCQRISGGRAPKAQEPRRRCGWECPLPIGEGLGEGAMSLAQNIFFSFQIVHSGAFSYTNSKVLFAIKCRERYFIMVFLAIDSDTDIKTSSFHQSRKLIPVTQSPVRVSSSTNGV